MSWLLLLSFVSFRVSSWTVFLFWFENHYGSRVYTWPGRWLQFSVVVSRCCVVIPSSLQLMKSLLLLMLVVALLLVGGYISVKLWGKKHHLQFWFSLHSCLLFNNLISMQDINNNINNDSQVRTCLSLCVAGAGLWQRLARVSLGYPWLFFLVRSLMGHMPVGRRGL